MYAMHPLDSPLLKARRAKLHLNALERSITTFIERHPYTVTQYESREFLEYFIKREWELPKVWGLLVGDFAHNLRSSLDHVAYQFNLRARTPVEMLQCQFPINDTRAGYRSVGSLTRPKGLGAELTASSRITEGSTLSLNCFPFLGIWTTPTSTGR